MRSAKDELVSGSVFSVGIVPPGVTVADDTNRGKIITFTNTTTPTNLYRIILSASEELVTSTDDPFLKNATITEDTSQKIRINYQINVVLDSAQTDTPVPYVSDVGAYNAVDLTNQVVITPSSGQNGELLSATPVSGANIDGRDLELLIRNDPGLGGGNVLPIINSDQDAFSNGKLIDSRGTEYHVNAIFLDSDTTKTVIRIDKELDQPDPDLINGSPYIVRKRDVYVQNSSTGSPVGKVFLDVAKIDWNATDELVHDSKVEDLRSLSLSQQEFQDKINSKSDIRLTDGGVKSFNVITELVNWSSQFSIINPHGPTQTIAAGTAAMVDGGSLTYEMNLLSGGALERGSIAVTVVSNSGTTTTLGSVDLSQVRIGNVLNVSSQLVTITAIDDVNDTLEVTPTLTVTGPGTIYLDSFGPEVAPVGVNFYTIAVRNGNKIWFENEVAGDSGFTMAQAYCFTDGTGTEVNCLPPTVVGGKTRITLNFSYVPGLNTGTANGQLEIFLNGQKIPRFIDGTLTPNASYVEVDSNTIDLDSDYSSFNIAVDIIKPIAVIDTSEINSLRLLNIYDAIVGTTAQVASGQATHDSLATAVSSLSLGGTIGIISNTTVNSLVTIPSNIRLILKSKSISLTLGSSGELRFTGADHIIEGLYLNTSQNIVLLRMQAENSSIKDCRFDAPPSGSATCVRVEGNANHIGECLFTGVLSPSTSTGIEFVLGSSDNTESNNIFTT